MRLRQARKVARLHFRRRSRPLTTMRAAKRLRRAPPMQWAPGEPIPRRASDTRLHGHWLYFGVQRRGRMEKWR